ncbi:peptidyl-tRNA hydrolase, PTH1 family [Ruminococcus sp. YE71]|uniref:aminoacyl-tRNA hydrolase n=1 Tax=unclassified Ruminococcus TaxID=2608920 RepID=UPI00087EAB66|nr:MULTISPECIES: aminoacyl-tRNA hydrolase [unclassified Ruminococcus]SDA15776.1 peptidyl-tRNA hydrolase, PTH1 family [Ruminococcus sp. YE78]SFW23169.1 peptidyl-tRNA hydrolase, PTH1 family [Ruminococcus sp. YE71]
MSIWDAFDRISKGREPQGGKIEFIIAGLGNPGIQYENSRHNAGFMAVAALEKKFGFEVKQHKFKAVIGEANIGGKRVLVMKPETYMNNSGEAIEQAMGFYKIPIENVLVIFDDISLEPGHIRVRRKGSAGGHNGLKSIIALCGGDGFPRIKLGVGAKPHPDYDLADWVLGKFDDDQQKAFDSRLDDACKAAEYIVGGSIDKAMNECNK